jgi:hypothetical protein
VAVELVEDTAAAVVYYPAGLPARPSTATLTVRDPANTSKETPSVTVVSVGAAGTSTVSTVTSQTVMVVDDATGLAAGDYVWCETADGWKGRVRIDELTSTTVTLEAAPPGTVTTATTLHGLKCSATIAAGTPATRGTNWRLEWAITDTDAVVTTQQQIMHVVRMVFRDPVTDGEVKRYVAAQWPGVAAGRTAGWFRGLSGRANRRVRDLLRASGDYPHLVGDHDALADAGLAALRLVLAEEGLTPGDWDRAAYTDTQRRGLNDSIRAALANTWVDLNDDKGVDAGEVSGFWTVRAQRS